VRYLYEVARFIPTVVPYNEDWGGFGEKDGEKDGKASMWVVTQVKRMTR
jgi:hypothetical protein